MLRSRKKYILFIESEALFGYSAFTQQFLMEAKTLKSQNAKIMVVAFESIKDILRKKSNMYKKVLKSSGIPYLIIPTWLRENMLIDSIVTFLNTLVLGFIAILIKTEIVHAHDRNSACYAVNLKKLLKLKVIYDIHGIGVEELIYSNQLEEHSERHKQLKKKEYYVVTKSDFIFVVSQKMKNYIVSKYRARTSKFVVTPTSVDTDLFSYSNNEKTRARNRLSLDKKFVVLFMGHFQSWQLNDAFPVVFDYLRKQIRNIHFLILSDGIEQFKKLFKAIGLSQEDYSIYSVEHDEVPNYAVAANLAVLLRDNSIVNRVAAPAKFGEYLALGLPVILTKGIGDTEDIVEKFSVGAVLKGLELKEQKNAIDVALNIINNGGSILSERCNRVARDFLSLEVCIPKFIATYEKCIK